jgi:spore germination cell wall hydrolase CwlJ-like protein
VLLAALTPVQAQDVQVAEVQPAALPQALLSDQLSAVASAPAQAEPAAAAPNLTPELLATYVARQQAQKGFDIFGEAPQPQLTSAMLSAYAATHLQNAALAAIDRAASPVSLATTFSVPAADTPPAEAAVPSISDDILTRYARSRFEPTEKKVAEAATEKTCLSSAIYHEARGESDNGQWAVANVIINRAMSKRFPTTMCGVVYQNVDQGRFHCQFTFACDGQPDVATERQAWIKANRIAAAAYSEFQHGQRPGVLPSSALYYHTASVSTDWGFRRVAQIGAHVFYSPM